MNLIDLDEIVQPCIDALDKKHLNKEIAYFSNKEVTPSHLAEYIFKQLSTKVTDRWPWVRLTRVLAKKPILAVFGSYGQSIPFSEPKGMSNS